MSEIPYRVLLKAARVLQATALVARDRECIAIIAQAILADRAGREVEIERLREIVTAYRAATAWICADSWDGCSDCMDQLKAASAYDTPRDDMTPDELASALNVIRPFKPHHAPADRERAISLENELSRVKAERDEAVATVGRLRGTLEYIKAQSVSKAYASTPAMALNVIRANAEAALDGDFQASVDAARSFLTRMENQKAETAPCGECRLQPGETCDICGRSQP